jgi:ABC-type polysaccharide/polyol phosphate transport system ATPase subunit
MTDIAIQVENLSKRYQIGARQKRYDTLRDQIADLRLQIADWSKRLFKSGIGNPKPEVDFIWALKDVSFEVKRGEVVGIIGRNGAGKSTLLKILARITKPTSGRARIFGRVGSLLEVGTGFHGELTGRENIYLSGAILGMKKREIDRKFDEIVTFAEVEKFIDTPVKRYSSGMYVRLAFAVAAHLEPEILLVDEVLAVGDAAFQKKCLGKMGDVAKEGRTVLFVSHNFEAVKSLCTRGIVLGKGSLVEDSSPSQAIEKLLASLRGRVSSVSFQVEYFKNSTEIPRPIAVKVAAQGKHPNEGIDFDDSIVASITLDSPVQTEHTFAFQICTALGTTIFNSFYRDNPDNPALQPAKTRTVSVLVPKQLLPAGVYEARFAYMLPNADLFWVTRETWFEVREIESYRNRGLSRKRTGIVSLILPWSNE